MTPPDEVRPLTATDLDWVLDLSTFRRERIARFAPTFWRPAPDARQRHGQFLGRLVDDPQVLSLRTEHGFVFGVPRGHLLDVDDMALDDESRWDDDGRRLLRAVGQHGHLRLVCPVPERVRTRTAVGLGMRLDETWWHRDLEPRRTAPVRTDPELTSGGTAGRLVEAPPVYAPGGPVLLVSRLTDAGALSAMEDAAALAGAVVSVVPQHPGDSERAQALRRAGYRRTTDFFSWRLDLEAPG